MNKLSDTLDNTSRAVALDLLEKTARSDSSAEVRRQALETLTGLGEQKASTILSEALADPDAKVRQQALIWLGEQPVTSARIDSLLNNMDETLANEPLAAVRGTACTALGQLWQKIAAAPDPDPLWPQRIQTLGEVLGQALSDSSLEVQQAAARALGSSGDLTAIRVIREYVRRGLTVKQAITPALDDVVEPDEIAWLLNTVPLMFPELIEAFLRLLAGVGEADDQRWRIAVQETQLMLHAAREFGEPAFLPLVTSWLEQPPERLTTDQGQVSVRGELHLLAIQALGKQPRTLASGPALALLQKTLDHQQTHRQALVELAGCLADLKGDEAISALLGLLEAPELQDDEATTVRLAAARGLQRVLAAQEANDDVRQRLLQRSTDDPAAEVRDALARVVQLLQPA
jgi:HEAT repeat protein